MLLINDLASEPADPDLSHSAQPIATPIRFDFT